MENNETSLNNNSFYASVFRWLALGLAITFGAGYLLYYQFPEMLIKLMGGAYFVILIAELILVIAFRVSISKMNFIVTNMK